MRIELPAEIETVLRQKVDSGAYANAEDVVRAAFAALHSQERFGEFDAGELDVLLAEGEASIASEGTLDGEAAFHARRERRAANNGTKP